MKWIRVRDWWRSGGDVHYRTGGDVLVIPQSQILRSGRIFGTNLGLRWWDGVKDREGRAL